MKLRICAVLAAALLVAADAKDDALKKEYEKSNGTWIPVSMEIEGQKLPEETLKRLDMKLTLKDDTYQIKADVEEHGTFKVDLSKKPKTIDIKAIKGPNEGKTILAIYEIDGDTLKACYSLQGKDRPTEFATKAGSGQALIVYRRQK